MTVSTQNVNYLTIFVYLGIFVFLGLLYRLLSKKTYQHDVHTTKYLDSNRISIDIVCQPNPHRPGKAFIYSTTLDSLTDNFVPLSIYNPIVKTYKGKEGYELDICYSNCEIPWFHNKLAYKGFILTNHYDAVSNRGYSYTTRGRPLVEIGGVYLFDRPLITDHAIS